MTKTKRTILIVLVLFVVITLAIMTSVRFGLFQKMADINDKDSYDINIEVLNYSIPTDIVLIGESIPFREALIYRKLTNVTSELLETHKKYQVIILSDLDGTLSISDQELLIIKEKVDNHTSDFYYLGKNQANRLKQLGFVDYDWPSDDYCIAVVMFEGKQDNFTGIWAESDVQATKDNRETLGLLLVKQFIRVLSSNN